MAPTRDQNSKDNGAAKSSKEDRIKRRDATLKKKIDKDKDYKNAKKELKRLEKLVEEYSNHDGDLEKRKLYEQHQIELEKQRRLKEEVENDLDSLTEEANKAGQDVEMTDVDMKEEDSSSAQQPPTGGSNPLGQISTDGSNPLGQISTAESSTLNPTGQLVAFQTISGSETNPIDLENELDLVTSEQSQPTAGIPDPDQHRAVQLWKRKSGGGRIAIVRYGPLNSAVFRREDVSQSDDLSQIPDYSDPKLRLGEQAAYVDGRKVWKVTRRNFISVQGVAFPDTATYKDLNPKRKKSQHWMHTDVLIKWKTDNGFEKSWETRTTFRRVWGKNKDDADDAIYRAAIWSEENFQKWKRGVRRTAERSPSQNPITAANNPANKKQKKKGKKGKERSKRPTVQDEENDSGSSDDGDSEASDDDDDDDDSDDEDSDSEDSDSEDSDSEDSDDSDSEDNDDDSTSRSFDPSKYASKYGLIEWRWIDKKIFKALSKKEQKKMMKKVKEAVEKEKMWRKHQDKKSKKSKQTKKAKTKKGRK